MSKIAPSFRQQVFDGNGNPLSGGLLYTYEAGTTTPKKTYTDSSEVTENTNPIVLDANGVADIWLASGAYKFVLKDSDDATIQTVDNILGDSTIGFNGSVVETAANLTVNTDYQNAFIVGTATLNLTLLPASSAGEGFVFTVLNDGTGTVTIDPDSAETINGEATLELLENEWAIVTCDGTNWRALAFKGVKNNFTATTDPTTSNDNTEGYAKNSTWFNTTSSPVEIWRCADASTGAAVWIKTTLTIDELGAAALKGVDTDFSAPSDDNVPTTLAVETRLGSLNFLESFESSEQTITSGGTLSIAHGLTTTPILIQCLLVCKTDNGGYSVGDVMIVNPSGSGVDAASDGLSIVPTSTDIDVRFGSGGLGAIRKDNGVRFDLTLGSWRLIVRAWA